MSVGSAIATVALEIMKEVVSRATKPTAKTKATKARKT